MKNKPSDQQLYNRVKTSAKKKFKKWPSAYASGWLVKEYKRKFAEKYGSRKNPYETSKKSKKSSSLKRWFDEEWVNVCEKDAAGNYKTCGRKTANSKKYPYCRPLKRISAKTPKTVSELSAKKIKEMCKKKRKTQPSKGKKPTRVYVQKRKSQLGGGMKSLPNGIKFVKGPNKKKYTAILPSGKKVHFGHRDYQHYKDSIPKRYGGGIWSHKDHKDKKRRDNYRKRHGGVKLIDGSLAINKKFSPAWFSYYYLW